jgi:hypothetical protein
VTLPLAFVTAGSSNPAMPSDVTVPAPASRRLTVPAAAVVVLVVVGAAWGVGMFLLGRQSAPPVEVVSADGLARIGWANRVDQALASGDLSSAASFIEQLTISDDSLSRAAVALRRTRLKSLQDEQAARLAAASPEAIRRRLSSNLRSLVIPGLTWNDPALAPIIAPLPNDPAVVVPVITPTKPALSEEHLGDQVFVPTARAVHPSISTRVYALHPERGLLRSDDAGKTWRVGLEPLTMVRGNGLAFTATDDPAVVILGVSAMWIFTDTEPAFFPH